MPGLALANAFTRMMQPQWRRFTDPEELSLIRRETMVLTASVSFPLFAIMVAIAPDLVGLWLGPGWDMAAALVPWLAVVAAVNIPFQVLASSFEMRSQFSSVRVTQAVQLVCMVSAVVAMTTLRDLHVLVAGMAFTAFLSLTTLTVLTERGGWMHALGLLRAIVVPALWASLVGVCAYGGVLLARSVSLETDVGASFLGVVLGALSATLCWVVNFRWQPAARVIAARGVRLPRVLVWRPCAAQAIQG